jgi:nitroreductase
MGGYGNSAEIDAAIAIDHLTLAAVADGLGTCWIGAFNEVGVKELLRVPADAKVVAMTPLGYPASADMNHPLDQGERRPPNEIFSIDRYGNPAGAD